MPNSLTCWAIRATHLRSHVVEYWLWRYRHLWSEVNIWNINCALATAFIFDTQALIWNLKVRFMGVVIGQGNAVSPVSDPLLFFALHQFMIYNSPDPWSWHWFFQSQISNSCLSWIDAKQNCSVSIANALEMQQCCTKPLIKLLWGKWMERLKGKYQE